MDTVLVSAVDLAREAAVEVAEGAEHVGDHLSATEDSDRLVTHLFGCTMPGYRGWVWSVTLSRAPRGREASVCEAHLIPADDALLAPSWVPWAERIRPGDLEPSMVLPRIEEDPRLMPGYEATGDEVADALAIWELGLGRERVLGEHGRDSAAERWYRGSHGPTAASAIASSETCSTCAFFVPLTGAMRLTFGACANEWSPSDGRVVSVDHGCGAHSQTDVEKQASQWPAADPVVDTDGTVGLDLQAEDEPEPQSEPETAPVTDENAATDAEPQAEQQGDATADATADASAPDAVESPQDASTADAPASEAVESAQEVAPEHGSPEDASPAEDASAPAAEDDR